MQGAYGATEREEAIRSVQDSVHTALSRLENANFMKLITHQTLVA